MTLRIFQGAPNSETHNAELFYRTLIESEPQLDHPDIRAEILCGLPLPGRQLDLVLIYHDCRTADRQLKTPLGQPIHSFVLVVEVKKHSPDLIRFEGPKVLVRYNRQWSDASDQCDAQKYALKTYQQASYHGRQRRGATLVHGAVWLARAPRQAFDSTPAGSGVPVHFADLTWNDLVSRLKPNGNAIRTLVDRRDDPKYHSIETLHDHLCYEVLPTQLDLRRINALTQTRFDADKTAYIRDLGEGLLILRGRGGTGKTFALVQIALHLARKGKRTVLLTYNHGLIADINRALRFIGQRDTSISPLPVCQTRYSYIQDVFMRTFGRGAEERVRSIPKIEEREEVRTRELLAESGEMEAGFDFALIDEGQDWSEEHRALVFHLFGSDRVVVADGVDQFVDQNRCVWDAGVERINRRHALRASRRTKGATCQTVAEIARELGLGDWDLEPDPEAHGGRFTVIVEPDARRAVKRGLQILAEDQRSVATLEAIDNLVCLPSSKMARGINYAAIFDDEIALSDRDSWRGFDEKDRRIYAIRQGQVRAVQYQSCRGMEGWTTLCLGLDLFYQHQSAHPLVDVKGMEARLRELHGLYYKDEHLSEAYANEARLFAVHWLMIPLTRSIDHLVVHLSDENSEMGSLLKAVSARSPGAIEWVGHGIPQ